MANATASTAAKMCCLVSIEIWQCTTSPPSGAFPGGGVFSNSITITKTNMIAINNHQLTKVIHNSNDDTFFIAGATVGSVRAALVDAFNIPVTALAFVNDLQVDFRHRLRGGETLEFCVGWGRKGSDDSELEYLTLAQAAKLIPGTRPGKRIAIDTIWRWCRKGVRGGVRLKSTIIGGRRFTTRKWLMEFSEALGETQDETVSKLTVRTTTQRNLASEKASEELDRIWNLRDSNN